jgi:hypothetical protein
MALSLKSESSLSLNKPMGLGEWMRLASRLVKFGITTIEL